MSLIISNTESIFNGESIHRGDLIRAKRTGWLTAKNGIVTAVTATKLTFLTMPNIGNVTNYFVITAEDAAVGNWEVRWTGDFVTISTHGVPEDGDA